MQLYLLDSSEQATNVRMSPRNDVEKNYQEVIKKNPVIESRNKDEISKMQTRCQFH